jgi:hypothetical protein
VLGLVAAWGVNPKGTCVDGIVGGMCTIQSTRLRWIVSELDNEYRTVKQRSSHITLQVHR